MDQIKIARMLCPVDYSDYSTYGLEYAVSLATIFEAELKLLHMVEVPVMPAYTMAGVPELSMPVEQIERAAWHRMRELIEKYRDRHAGIEGEVRTGNAFVGIVNCAREMDADLIVMGTHGHTGLKHILIGSVAEKVVRKAPCPVLTVKHPRHTFEMP